MEKKTSFIDEREELAYRQMEQKEQLETARYKQDCRKRALDMAHQELLNLTAASMPRRTPSAVGGEGSPLSFDTDVQVTKGVRRAMISISVVLTPLSTAVTYRPLSECTKSPNASKYASRFFITLGFIKTAFAPPCGRLFTAAL